MKEIYHDDEEEIKNLFVGHSIKKVSDDELLLDNGVRVKVHPNEGCGGCNSGWYDLKELNETENVITNIKFVDISLDEGSYDYRHSYQIYVWSEWRPPVRLLDVQGDDGNGYYGTGYWLEVCDA